MWAEDTGTGKHAIFVVAAGRRRPLRAVQRRRPASRTRAATPARPDITFFGNVPYVSWIEAQGERQARIRRPFRQRRVRARHVPLASRWRRGPSRASLIDARVPLSSSCTADPFTNDGSACPVAAVNAPFLTCSPPADSPQRLFGQAVIGGPNCVLFTSCNVGVVVTGRRRCDRGHPRSEQQHRDPGSAGRRYQEGPRHTDARGPQRRTRAAGPPSQGQGDNSLEPEGERSPAQARQVPDHSPCAGSARQRARRHEVRWSSGSSTERKERARRRGSAGPIPFIPVTPVSSLHAAQNGSSACSSNCARTIAATAVALNGRSTIAQRRGHRGRRGTARNRPQDTPAASRSGRRSRSRRSRFDRVSGGLSTALLLGHQRSDAVGVDCLLEDDRYRTNAVRPSRCMAIPSSPRRSRRARQPGGQERSRGPRHLLRDDTTAAVPNAA